MKRLIEFSIVDPKLSSRDTKILVTKGAKLFELMDLTPEAKAYLEYNADLAEVVQKW